MRTSPAERWILRAIVAMLVLIVAVPMSWALVTALKTEANVITYPPSFLPSPATLESFGAVLRHQTFATELMNSVVYALAAIALTIAVSVPAGIVVLVLGINEMVVAGVLRGEEIPGVGLQHVQAR